MIADGDSFSTTFGGVTPWPSEVTLTRGPWTVTNIAVPGETLQTMLANAPSHVDSIYNTNYLRNVVVLWGGQNDLATGRTPAQIYSDMQSYCNARHAVSSTFFCVVATMPAFNPSFDAGKNTFNNLLLANHSWADALVDFTGTPLGCDGCSSNPTYYMPNAHPTQFAIDNVEVPAFNSAVNGLP